MKIPRPEAVPGTMLPMREYAADFLEVFHDVDGVIWKLERAQTFDEGENPSWKAMRAGDWHRSLELLEEARETIAADLPARGSCAACGSSRRRSPHICSGSCTCSRCARAWGARQGSGRR